MEGLEDDLFAGLVSCRCGGKIELRVRVLARDRAGIPDIRQERVGECEICGHKVVLPLKRGGN
jgi:hypothetical protein